ncbi:lysosomal protective protein-like [Asterias amurensis]|uniref:lysosomal protective protein-like n=1 Tax=Asterias amurensis TaxID=7602 RepID=UPI003AB85882
MGKFILVISSYVLCLAFFGETPTWARPAEDEVKNLPGVAGPLSSKQYSGYLKGSGTVRLHYWFVESQTDPKNDPVILWLNGGPSCSSLEGYLSELGPYWVNSYGNKTLSVNEYSWTKVANVIFLESPAGVGFSYNENKNYSTDDDQTAENNLLALKDFFQKFQNMASNEFFIAGESYAGIYIPTLAVKVMKTQINFKGFAIGNGFVDAKVLSETKVEYAYYHALIGESLWKRYQTTCGSSSKPSTECTQLKREINELIEHSGINPYDITGDCNGSYSNSELASISILDFMDPEASVGTVSKKFPGYRSPFLPCVNNVDIEEYLNQPDVKTALHIPDFVTQKWTLCNPALAAIYTKLYNTTIPLFQTLLPNYRALLYNGDADIVCNFLGDQKFVEELGQPVLGNRRAWRYRTQVAGFVKEYKQITFMTVKDSGHMVPQVTPGPALQMITNFLNNKPQ